MERVCQEHPCCRDCHAPALPAEALPQPPTPADAQKAEPPQPSASWHPWTSTRPRSWRCLACCCENPVPQFPPAVLSLSHSMGSSLPGSQPHTLIPLPIPILHTIKTNSLLPSWTDGTSMAPSGLCKTLLWGSAPLAPSQPGLSPSSIPRALGMGGGCPCPPVPSLVSPCMHRKPHRGFGVFGCLSAASGMPMVPPGRTRGILEAGSRGGRGQTSTPLWGDPVLTAMSPYTPIPEQPCIPRDPPDPLFSLPLPTR